MRILLTNDDGYEAPGLLALWRAVRELPGVEIEIVAPLVVHSGKGHTLSREIGLHFRKLPELGEVVAVDGSPADCVRAALALPDARQPDWVLAGINHGSNLGVDVYYSGTVAAAREAALIGIPAVAVSQLVKTEVPDDWALTVRRASSVIAAIIAPDAPPPAIADAELHREAVEALRTYRDGNFDGAGGGEGIHVRANPDPVPATGRRVPCWNVNLPRLGPDQKRGSVEVVPVCKTGIPVEYTHAPQEDGSARLRYATRYHFRPAAPGTDIGVVFAGGVAISPVFL